MTKGLRLKSLSFHGPHIAPAIVEFGAGLNVIYGASNTGKSFIVDAIDFMLGGKGPLRDIPERVGYDRVLLAIETLANEQFTIVRSTEGGAFKLFDGLHSVSIPEGEGTVLAEQHNERKDDNLSSYLLSKIDLNHKCIRRNKRNDTNSLSFRNIARLLIINEEEIIQQRSPLSDGNPTADTPNISTFKLLLTGVDDSALITAQVQTPEEQSRSAQLELLDELIADYYKQINELAGKEDLEDQLERLDASMNDRSYQLAQTEFAYRQVFIKRRDLTKRVEDSQNRIAEIKSLLERFTLLGTHYDSDVERLKGIEEAGSLFGALAQSDCPLCGAEPDHQMAKECDGNVDQIISAAQSEITKIEIKQKELTETVATLNAEAANFERRMPKLQQLLFDVSREIEGIVAPNLRKLRASYKELADKSGEVREALAVYRSLTDFEERRAKLDKEPDAPSDEKSVNSELPTSVVDNFATTVLGILKAWHFPEIDRVSFDLKLRDLVINGKNRTSYGKGLRAITQAAFTVGLMECCRQNQKPHPGFVILDSPLLSYREPDNAADDLRGTDLNEHFYSYLNTLRTDRQIIIIENTDPPRKVQGTPQAIQFTGIKDMKRYGFFPIKDIN